MKQEKSCGAVVWRPSEQGPEILIEHMALGHTSLPKGHVESGESEEETALREIREETALTVRLDTGFRHTIRYSPAPGVEKDVVFFVAEALEGAIVPQLSEVRSAVFLPAEEAMAALTFDSDRETVAAACAYLAETRALQSAADPQEKHSYSTHQSEEANP